MCRGASPQLSIFISTAEEFCNLRVCGASAGARGDGAAGLKVGEMSLVFIAERR